MCPSGRVIVTKCGPSVVKQRVAKMIPPPQLSICQPRTEGTVGRDLEVGQVEPPPDAEVPGGLVEAVVGALHPDGRPPTPTVRSVKEVV